LSTLKLLPAVLAALVAVVPAAATAQTASSAGAGAPATTTSPGQTSATIPAARDAGDTFLVSAGGQIDTANAAYVGVQAALPGSVIGRGFALAASGFGGNYSYLSGSLGIIRGTFAGAELDALYELSSQRSWNSIGAGVRDVNTQLTPFDTTNRRRGDVIEFAATAYGGAIRGPYRGDYFASYGTRLQDYTARGDVTHALGSSLRLGLALSFEGDPTYALHEIGPFAGIALGRRSELQISTGASQQTGRGTSGYLRASIYRSL